MLFVDDFNLLTNGLFVDTLEHLGDKLWSHSRQREPCTPRFSKISL